MYLSYDKTSTYDLGSGKAEILDIRTPRHGKFAARYKRSHSYTIMNEIVPEILENVIMDLTDNKAQYEKKYGGETASEDILWAIRKIKRLKFRVQNDNKFKPFLGLEPDRELWNDFLSKLPPRQNTFYSACCLYAECFVYRRVQSYFENSKALKEFDVYHKEKKKLLAENMTAVEALLQCSRSLTVSDEALIMLIRVWNCLEPEKILSWGLRCTPVVNVARVTKNSADPFVALREADKRTLINRSYKACSVINEVDRSKPVIIEILCEKCGYDLIADLVTADYFIMNKLANKVRFNVKPIPWNVADVTAKDIDWTLKFLREQQSVVLQEFARRWMGFLDDGKFEVAPPEYFWASPYEFYRLFCSPRKFFDFYFSGSNLTFVLKKNQPRSMLYI